GGGQATGVPRLHAPMLQRSSSLQGSRSLQLVPSRSVCWQVWLGPHESAVQGFWSSQLFCAGAAVHTPAWQVLAAPHSVGGAQTVPCLTLLTEQPVFGSQLSLVQGLLSLQSSGPELLTQLPPLH